MGTYAFDLTDTITNKSSGVRLGDYVSDHVNKKNNESKSRYPLLVPVAITTDIKKILDSKSLNLMDLLSFHKINNYFSLSDLLGVLVIQNIAYSLISLNSNFNPTGLCSSALIEKASSNPALTSDVYANKLIGGIKTISISSSSIFSLFNLWKEECKNDTDLRLYIESNLSCMNGACSNAREMFDYYTTYLMSDDKENTTGEPYTIIPGEPFNSEAYGIVQPIFIYLKPASGLFLNVRENQLSFFSEYVKLHYKYLPIQVVSTLDIFKKYVDIL